MGAKRRTRWTDDHGVDGLRDKFRVYHAGHVEGSGLHPGYDMFASHTRIGATGEFVFVLRPESDEAAYHALRDYVSLVAWRAPQLSEDIARELDRIVGEQA